MKHEILIYKEKNVKIQLDKLVEFINSKSKTFQLVIGKNEFTLQDEIIYNPSTYKKIDTKILDECKNKFHCAFLTKKPYYNNYFDDPYNNLDIISFSAWESYTNLSLNNGFVYFLCAGLADLIDSSDENCNHAGCIYDFLGNKTSIDIGMRYATIHEECQNRILPNIKTKEEKELLSELQFLLNELSSASKWNKDIVEYWDNNNITNETPEKQNSIIINAMDFLPSDTNGINVNRENIQQLHESFSELSGSTNKNKGQLFETFSKSFFNLIQNWTKIGENVRITDAEIDLIYRNENQLLDNNRFGNIIYIECKNRKKSAGVRDISHFAMNMLLRGEDTKVGIFFSNSGISGYKPENPNERPTDAYERILNIQRQLRRTIIPFVNEDIEFIKNGGNLVTLLRDKVDRFTLI